MAKEIKITVRVKNLVARGLESAKRSLENFRKFANFTMRGVGIAAKAGAVGVGLLGVAIRGAFKKEGYINQFKFFTGTLESAKQRWEALEQIINTSEYDIAPIVELSKTLDIAGKKGEENVRWVRMIGDAASRIDPSRIEEIGDNIARALLGVQTGEMLEPLKQLELIGVLSAGSAKAINDLGKATGNTAAVSARLSQELAKFNGGMASSANLGNGLVSTAITKVKLAFMQFGDVVSDVAKESIVDFNKAVDRVVKSDAFQKWAQKTADALRVVKSILTDLFGTEGERNAAFQDIKTIFAEAAQIAVKTLIDGVVLAGKLFREGMISGATAADKFTAIQNLKGQGKLGDALGGRFLLGERKYNKEQLEMIRKEADKVFRERVTGEAVGDMFKGGAAGVFERRAGAQASSEAATKAAEKPSAAPLGIGMFGAFNKELFAKLFPKGITKEGVAAFTPQAPSPAGPTEALSVGDLFAMAYGGKAGKAPTGKKGDPIYVVNENPQGITIVPGKGK